MTEQDGKSVASQEANVTKKLATKRVLRSTTNPPVASLSRSAYRPANQGNSRPDPKSEQKNANEDFVNSLLRPNCECPNGSCYSECPCRKNQVLCESPCACKANCPNSRSGEFYEFEEKPEKKEKEESPKKRRGRPPSKRPVIDNLLPNRQLSYHMLAREGLVQKPRKLSGGEGEGTEDVRHYNRLQSQLRKTKHIKKDREKVEKKETVRGEPIKLPEGVHMGDSPRPSVPQSRQEKKPILKMVAFMEEKREKVYPPFPDPNDKSAMPQAFLFQTGRKTSKRQVSKPRKKKEIQFSRQIIDVDALLLQRTEPFDSEAQRQQAIEDAKRIEKMNQRFFQKIEKACNPGSQNRSKEEENEAALRREQMQAFFRMNQQDDFSPLRQYNFIKGERMEDVAIAKEPEKMQVQEPQQPKKEEKSRPLTVDVMIDFGPWKNRIEYEGSQPVQIIQEMKNGRELVYTQPTSKKMQVLMDLVQKPLDGSYLESFMGQQRNREPDKPQISFSQEEKGKQEERKQEKRKPIRRQEENCVFYSDDDNEQLDFLLRRGCRRDPKTNTGDWEDWASCLDLDLDDGNKCDERCGSPCRKK